MIIYFVRHGQTDWNRTFRWQGRSDIELNATGREQALAVRNWFVDQGLRPSAIVSSPKKRARATAESLASAYGQTPIIEPAFTEVDLGEFEGKTTDDLQKIYGAFFSDWLGNYHLTAPPGGESLEQAIERMYPALCRQIDTHGDQMTIVAHQAILMAMKAALSGDLSLPILACYKQANYEIDVWDVDRARIQKRIDIRSGS